MNHVFVLALLIFFSCKTSPAQKDNIGKHEVPIVILQSNPEYKVLSAGDTLFYVSKTEAEWKGELSAEEFYILRKKGTERSFAGDLWDFKGDVIFTCRACGLELFDSSTKFKSGTGWPSYYQPIKDEHIRKDTDHDLGYARTEVMCERCGGHLGHVFNDGPEPTGLRYCINSASLDYKEK